ncbi:DNA alkylation repair protein [Candidatus Falkowbacteria bacterium CG10_big_fil_rev_8_21_14_0_10_43_10]|uniref:DNA alkylation repair protein n=1 Tax=Candidatus Falkowbacteria bacterium CG10_big_fil_rev_8_21_14_0_10_43_10 TaxID=1974567 RepID=A0A2H0V3J1_9BACT|nr:MAG: DNA alkylation repair protein [Candidatus Falkowbacteria bacterium CG10_big_fil_rev_8_21_14_0_10_43_10]
MPTIQIKKELKKYADPKKAKILQRFFKTGPGEYGEGDVFLGLASQQIILVAKKFFGMDLKSAEYLLRSKIHEERMLALRILMMKFNKGDLKEKEDIYKLYLKNARNINNWDLVDVSAPKIVGLYLLDKPCDILYKLARSKNLWEKRIAMLSTFAFIREKQFVDALKIAEIFLRDKHDLMHKAVGWMLREVGNRDRAAEEKFLKQHYQIMPRTMLRYAIEKFPEKLRQKYLRGLI